VVSARDPKAPELRSVAPLVVLGASPAFVGPLTFVENDGKVVGITRIELLRPLQGESLAVVSLDGTRQIPVKSWMAGRYTGLGLVELAGALPPELSITPLGLDAVSASTDVRGAPAAMVAIAPRGAGFEQIVVPVHVDADDGGGMSDRVTRLVSPIDAVHASVAGDGAPVFAWCPPEPALGRASQVLVVAITTRYRAAVVKPRETPVLGELAALDDLGRALISHTDPAERPELAPVTGEVVES
jgi:hypothetical protein